MTTCNICGATYTPPDTGDKMPLDAPGWDFVCWTPGKLETAVFTHRPWACRDVLKKRVVTLEAMLQESWEDTADDWTIPIKAAHPTRSGSHDTWAVAMKMVGHRHSKYELVALVNWLLVETQNARKRSR